jgi:hypothetical protein
MATTNDAVVADLGGGGGGRVGKNGKRRFGE